MRITIGAGDFGEIREQGRFPTEARLKANGNFKTSDGIFVLAGGDADPEAYQRFSITMVGATMRVNSGQAHSTTDSSRPGVTYTLDAYDEDGAFICNLLSRIRITNEKDPTTWDEIDEFSRAKPQNPPSTYLDSAAILHLFDTIVSNGTLASDVQRGITKLDVAPADLSNPLAIGVNSPLLAGIGGFAGVGALGRTQLDYAPTIPTVPIAVGANSPRFTKDLALDYGNSFATAITNIGSNNVRLVVSAPVTEAADRTLPVNIQLDVRPEGLITINSTKTLTIGSLKNPGNRQIFTGAGNIRLGRGAVEHFNTAWFTGPATGASIKNALDQLLASCLANQGGLIRIPTGTWLTTGNHAIPSGTIIKGAGTFGPDTATELKLTAGSVALLKVLPGTFNISVRDLLGNGNAQTSSTGFLAEGTYPTDAIVSNLHFDGVTFFNCTDGMYLHGISNWQIRQVYVSRSCIFQGNSRANLRIATGNSQVICNADQFISPAADGIWVESVGGLKISGSEFGNLGGSFGSHQVETQVIAGAVTLAGIAQSTVTAAFMNGGTPFVVPVPVTTADNTPALISLRFAQALARNALIKKYCHVMRDSPNVMLSPIDPAANDGTFNFSIENGTATGITASATSTNTNAGVAASGLPNSCIKITGDYDFISIDNTQDEAAADFIQLNATPDAGGEISVTGGIVQGRILLTAQSKLIMNHVVTNTKAVRDAAGGSLSTVVNNGCNIFTQSFIGGGVRTVEQRLTNFSDATGATGSILNSQAAGESFDAPRNKHEIATRFVQSAAGAIFHPTANPWVEVLGKGDQVCFRVGRSDDSGYADYYYDFWRDSTTGFLKVQGNQAGFVGMMLNGVMDTLTLKVGSGDAVSKILRGNVTIDPASVAANTVATQTFTLTGAATGDSVVLNTPTAGLTAGLLVLNARISATNTLSVTFYNTTGGAIDEASATWKYLLVR